MKYCGFAFLFPFVPHTLDPSKSERAPTTRIFVPVSPSGHKYFPNARIIFIGGVGGGLSNVLSVFEFFWLVEGGVATSGQR
jgi:hypothetical protein